MCVLRMIKSILRFTVLIGAVCGLTLRSILQKFTDFVEHNAVPGPNLQLLVLLAFLSVACASPASFSFCNEQNVIRSQVKNCKQSMGDMQECLAVSHAEITFKNLEHTICLWFTDEKERDVFQINLKLTAVNCAFSTKREYFTFPVQTRTLSQLSCAQNEFCSWGYHCHKGARFEALTPEAESYPGFTDCLPSNVGSGCTIISRQSCLFYSVYFIPDLIQSYEVRSIVGYDCEYEVTALHVVNNSQEFITVTDEVTTKTGIKLQVLGAFNQPHIFLKESLIQRVGFPEEAYLQIVSPTSRPIAGQIGQVQSNTSFSKDFIFDPQIVTCDFFETTLRCTESPDFLSNMVASKTSAIPSAREMHSFRIKEGKLVSTLLSTSPVKFALTFSNYKFSISSKTVCPQIKKDSIKITGCYGCQILANIDLSAHSTCEDGVAEVSFVQINTYTRTIVLSREFQELTIQFMAESRCYQEKLCLRSVASIQCELISFCLQEPTVELLNLNTSYTRVAVDSSPQTDYGLFSWMSVPTISGVYNLVKLISGILLIICLLITLLSSLITCCCRR